MPYQKVEVRYLNEEVKDDRIKAIFKPITDTEEGVRFLAETLDNAFRKHFEGKQFPCMIQPFEPKVVLANNLYLLHDALEDASKWEEICINGRYFCYAVSQNGTLYIWTFDS